MSKPSDLVQGALDLLLMKLEPLNGSAISHRLRQILRDILQVSEGSLYPALYHLEQQGSIRAEWKLSESNCRAKFHSRTPSRPPAARTEAGNSNRLSAPISHIVKLKEA